MHQKVLKLVKETLCFHFSEKIDNRIPEIDKDGILERFQIATCEPPNLSVT